MNIAIIGLGLIGGSYAKSTKSRTLHTVYGFDLDQEVMMFARMTGAIDKALTDELLETCALVIVALRPGAAISWTREHAETLGRGKCTVVDICGVKRAVCTEMGELAEQNGFQYIGGHPMAGKETGGFVNATDNLFDGASMILTPDARTDLKMLELLKNYFTDIGFAHLTFFHAGRARPHHRLHLAAGTHRFRCVCQIADRTEAPRLFRGQLPRSDARGPSR